MFRDATQTKMYLRMEFVFGIGPTYYRVYRVNLLMICFYGIGSLDFVTTPTQLHPQHNRTFSWVRHENGFANHHISCGSSTQTLNLGVGTFDMAEF